MLGGVCLGGGGFEERGSLFLGHGLLATSETRANAGVEGEGFRSLLYYLFSIYSDDMFVIAIYNLDQLSCQNHPIQYVRGNMFEPSENIKIYIKFANS